MTKTEWKDLIKQHTESAGTYRPEFMPTVDTLSEILEQRDQVYNDYIASGEGPIIIYTSDRGSTNMKENPRIETWSKLNNQALTFWRDLGLTPAGLKKINEGALDRPKLSALSEALKSIELNGKNVSTKSNTVRKKGGSGKNNSRSGSKTGDRAVSKRSGSKRP